MQLGYTQSVHCLICARPARRGATLCAQCKAALRRARHTPSVDPGDMPHSPVVRTEARRAAERNSSHSRPTRPASRAGAPLSAPLGGWGTYATIISFGLAVCLTGYLAIGENGRPFSAARTAELTSAPTARVEPRENSATLVPSVSAEAESSYELVADEHIAIFESLADAPRVVVPRKVARGSSDGKRATATAAMLARDLRTETLAVLATPAVMAVAATSPAASQPQDSERWQQFLSALSRCERENVITGLVCKERARLQYCDGEWGGSPQCPVAVASLNTR